MILLVAALCAADASSLTASYPIAADLVLPETGVVRIALPPELRSTADPADASDLLLQNGRGEVIPVGRLESSPVTVLDAEVVPTRTPGTYAVTASGQVARLDFGRTAGDFVAQVHLERQGVALTEPLLVYRIDGYENLHLEVPGGSRAFDVVVAPYGDNRVELARVVFEVVGSSGPVVHDDVYTLPVGRGVADDGGWLRYTVSLPGPGTIVRITPSIVDQVFDRDVAIWVSDPADPLADAQPVTTLAIRRANAGGVRVDHTSLDTSLRVVQDLGLGIESVGQPPLRFESVEVRYEGVELVAVDPGPGPHRLYAGAAPGARVNGDLEGSAAALWTAAGPSVRPGPVTSNPDYAPIEVRLDLTDPGPDVLAYRARWSRSVRGSGLVSIPVDDHVWSHAKSGLEDLRLVTADNRQIPYLIRWNAGSRSEELPFERTEDGHRTVLRVQIPRPNTWVDRIELTTATPAFDRTVMVETFGEAGPTTLRAVSWNRPEQPESMAIAIHYRMSGELVVTIDNGDNPPIDLTSIRMVEIRSDVLAYVDGEARLLYGYAGWEAPNYDLSALRSEVLGRQVALAELGEPEANGGPSLSLLDRGTLCVGIGLMSIGVVVWTAWVLRKPTPAPSAG